MWRCTPFVLQKGNKAVQIIQAPSSHPLPPLSVPSMHPITFLLRDVPMPHLKRRSQGRRSRKVQCLCGLQGFMPALSSLYFSSYFSGSALFRKQKNRPYDRMNFLLSGLLSLFFMDSFSGQPYCLFAGQGGCIGINIFIPTQQAILDTWHFCLDFVIIHALCDLYYPVSMDYTDRLLSNRYHHW